MHPSVRYYALKVCERDILQAAFGNFTKFAAYVQIRAKMTCSHFEIERSKVKVTVRPNVVRITCQGLLYCRRFAIDQCHVFSPKFFKCGKSFDVLFIGSEHHMLQLLANTRLSLQL